MVRKFLGLVIILIFISSNSSDETLQSGIGMSSNLESRPRNYTPPVKRRPSETDEGRQMVTIDLSALRPSLPGLILYKYGDQAPKLVQVDLSALNPQLQPHVVWPQFDQLGLDDDRPFGFDSLETIPYLGEDESLISPRYQRVAKMTEESKWPDLDNIADSDIYDFLPGSLRNEELMSLHRSLPLADEVIVPLDWEDEKMNGNTEKRSAFTSTGWQPGGTKHEKTKVPQKYEKVRNKGFALSTPFRFKNWQTAKKKPQERETESDDNDTILQATDTKGKKNVFISNSWGAGGRPVFSEGSKAQNSPREQKQGKDGSVRISSQESWSVPKQYWSVPHLLGTHWQ